MRFQRKKLAGALAYALGAGGAFVVAGTPAEAADIKVEVTGSSIRRVESEGALPIQTITRDDIDRQGIQSTAELVDRLSANSSIGGLNAAGVVGSTATGYASASLRGLGSQRTLVLLNGRRTANNAFSGATVDLNSIPLSAIERVEVLTDGASAVYGTDAIAGVINFILRKDYTGAEASAYYGDSDNGGGTSQRYNVSAGWGDLTKDKVNIYGSLDYKKDDAVAAAQRKFSKTAYMPNADGGVYDKTSGNSFPGNVFLPAVPGRPKGTTQNPTYPNCAPPYSFGTLTASTLGQCRFDYASVIDILPPSEQWNAVVSGRWQFHPDHQAFFDATYSQNKTTARISPSPVSAATLLSGEPILTQPGTPYYPTALATQYGLNGQPLEVFYRSLELGPRTDTYDTKQTRVAAGLQGVIKGWDYTAALNWGKSEANDSWPSGWITGSAFQSAVNTGNINLFGFNTPTALAQLQSTQVTGNFLNATGETFDVDVKASNEIYQLPAGPLALALGGNWRREKYVLNSSQAAQDGDVVGLGGSVASIPEHSRNVWAAYFELNIPIIKNLEGNIAVRYDDYQDVGSTTNPKFSLRWQPMKELLLRGSWGTGFRAPSLYELYQPAQYGATGESYDDPLRCPSTGSPRDCNAQFTTQLGGNPNLKPETSTQWTVGGVWEPAGGVSLGVEYWNIEVDDVIGLPAESPIFSDMPASQAAGTLVRYAPGSPGCSASDQAGGLPCPVNYGVQLNANLLKLKTSGVDFNIALRSARTDYGSLNFTFNGTYYIDWDQQSQGEDMLHLIGRYGGGVAATVAGSGSTGGFPRWKHSALLNWNYGPWQANLTQNYIHSYTDADETRTVGSFSLWGINGAYTGLKNWTFALGVKNLFNTDPPFTVQENAFQIGYDPALADPMGRFFWGSVKFAWK
jgi:iron complex outermembrane recepter protein